MYPLIGLLFIAAISSRQFAPALENTKLADLQAATQRQPNDAGAWLAFAQELDRTGQESVAISAYEKAASQPVARESLGRYTRLDDAGVAAAHYHAAATAYDHAGDSEAAVRCWCEMVRLTGDQATMRKVLERQAPNPTAAKLLPELIGKCGRSSDFIPELRRWTESLPEEAGPISALAECANDETWLLRWLEKRADPLAYATLARMRTADPAKLVSMVRELDSLASEQPDRAKVMMAGLQTEPAAMAVLLKNYSAPRHNRWQNECQRVIRLAIAGDCLDLADTTLKSWLPTNRHHGVHVYVYDALLLIYEQSGQFARAEELSRKCLKDFRDEEALLFHYHRARALMHLDRETEALDAAAEVVGRASGGNMVNAHLLHIDVLSWFGQHDAAQVVAGKLLKDFPDAASERRIRLRLAAVAENRRDDAVAEGHLLRVLELVPKDAEAQNNLGYYWADQNRRLADAERLCRFAVNQGRPSAGVDDPGGDEAAYRDSLGWVYFRQGRWIAAQEQLERSLALPGGKLDAVVWEHYGDVLAARGKSDRARLAWANAVARFEAKRTSRDDPRPAELKRKLNAKEG